jgi:uncharacterized protein
MPHHLPHVRVAHSFLDRLVGLIGERSPDRLFLLIPRCSSIHTAFMSASIDVVFLDEGAGVLAIVEDARPWRVFAGPRGTQSVLELPAGQARVIGLAAGDVVTFE